MGFCLGADAERAVEVVDRLCCRAQSDLLAAMCKAMRPVAVCTRRSSQC